MGAVGTATENLLVAVKGKLDWYSLPREWVPEIGKVPSIQFLSGKPIIHRTQLPLILELHPEARLTDHYYAIVDDAEFDKYTLPLGWQLRSYQHRVRRFATSRRGTLLALQQRTGKTPTAVSSHDPSLGPLVVVAPLATRHVWLTWFNNRWPDIEPLVLTGRRYDRSVMNGRPLVFTHYDILPTWESFGCKRIGTLVFDECHLLARKSSLRTQASFLISSQAERVLALSGTPMWNKPIGLWPVLACLNPGAWGKHYDFGTRYSDGHPGPHGWIADGASNVDEFKLRLTEVMIRLTWDDVAEDLPATERRVECVALSSQQLSDVEVAAESIRKVGSRRIPVGELARYRRLTGEFKLDATVRYASDILQSENVVIWTWHKDVAHSLQDKLLQAGFKAVIITGNDNQDDRDEILSAWRSATQPTALVITLAVGQAGIDLAAARHCIFAEIDFTPAVISQAEMRTFSPSRAMTATYIVLDHRVDRAVVNALQKKCTLAQQIGTPAADSAIDIIGDSFSVDDKADLNRLLQAVVSEVEDE